MSNTNDLKAALQKSSGKAEPPAAKYVPNSGAAPSRQGKKGIVIYVNPEGAKALRQIALDHGTSIQAIGVEALNDLLVKYNEKPII